MPSAYGISNPSPGAQVGFFVVTHDVQVVFLCLEPVFRFFQAVLQAELHVGNGTVQQVRDVLVLLFPGIMDACKFAVFPDELEQVLETMVVIVVDFGSEFHQGIDPVVFPVFVHIVYPFICDRQIVIKRQNLN